MKKIKSILLIILILLFTYIPHHLMLTKFYALHISYVDLESIDTPELNAENIKYALRIFNYYGYKKIVRYSGKRPIYIKEVRRNTKMYEYFKDRLAGLAWVGIMSCTIYLNPDIAENGLEEVYKTIIHEYLHCLGYSHVDNRRDLMYYSSGSADWYSVVGYAESLFLHYLNNRILIRTLEELWNSIKN